MQIMADNFLGKFQLAAVSDKAGFVFVSAGFKEEAFGEKLLSWVRG